MTQNSQKQIAGVINDRVGLYSSIMIAVLTIITFGFAMTAIPIAGPHCPKEWDCISYPYLESLSQFPKDYLWMVWAMFQNLAFVGFLVSLYAYTEPPKKIYSQIGVIFGCFASLILMVAYYTQFSVVPVSLMNEEHEGIALLTQYNTHGVFIALEELAYILIALSLVFFAPALTNKSRLESAVRWIYLSGCGLAIIALIFYLTKYGIEKKDHYEVAIISIDWLVLISTGITMSIVFKRRLRASNG